jgi:APA family basic amino acid/polyamine antiporter
MMFFAYAASATAVTTSLAAENAGHFIGKYVAFTPVMSRGLTVAIIFCFMAVNCIGVRESGKTQNVLTLLKVGGIVTVIGACFFLSDGHPGSFTPLFPAGRPIGEATGSLGTAMILTIFSYSGWYFITHVAGEVREPEKNLPRAIFAGMGILIVLYVAVNAAYLYVLPFDSLQRSPRVAADALGAVFGPLGADVISAIAFLSAIGAANAQLLNYPRIPFALASDGVFFERLARVHPTRRTPIYAISVFALIACTFAATGTYQQNLTYVGFVGQLFMALTVIGLIVLRRREPDLPRPFRVPLYPLVPLLYVAILTWYLANLLVNRFAYSLVGIAIVLAGLPFYFYWTRRNAREAR